MTQHACQLRPVTRDGDEWRALPLLRAAWDGSTPVAWMLWCTTCRSAVEGTELADSADCDLEDLLSRFAEFSEWEKASQTAHRAWQAST